MQDILKDIVTHTKSIGIELVKVKGDDTQTFLEAVGGSSEIILHAKTNKIISELKGTFGLPNLDKLDHHLKNPEYQSNAKIDVIWEDRNGSNQPVSIMFTNESGDYVNDYKLTKSHLVNDKVKSTTFKGSNIWQVEIVPSVIGINRFKLQQQSNNEENNFLVKTENDSLVFYFGDPSTHEGRFVFHSGITGKLKQNWSYPIEHFINILNLDGDKTVKFTDDGAVLITIDSGLINYNYYILAQTK